MWKEAGDKEETGKQNDLNTQKDKYVNEKRDQTETVSFRTQNRLFNFIFPTVSHSL